MGLEEVAAVSSLGQGQAGGGTLHTSIASDPADAVHASYQDPETAGVCWVFRKQGKWPPLDTLHLSRQGLELGWTEWG